MAKAKASKEPELTQGDLEGLRKDISSRLKVPIYFGNDEKLKLSLISTGISKLDQILGGGIARDRITLVTGEYSTGKTLFAFLTIKSALESNLTTAFIDAEKTWHDGWVEQLGIDASKVMVVRPKTAEQGFDAAIELVKSGIDVMAIDSLVALRPLVELDADMTKQFMGNHAKLVNRGLQDTNSENIKTAVIAINQIRSKVGMVWGSPDTTPGGKGQDFVAWQKIRVRRAGFIETGAGDTKEVVGQNIKFEVEKSKQNTPWGVAVLPFYYTGEFDEVAGMLEMGIACGLIAKMGSANYFIGEEKFFGRNKIIDAIKERPDLQNLIKLAYNSLPTIEEELELD